MMNEIQMFPRAKPEVRERIINEIVKDNSQFTMLRQQLDCMVPFTINKALGLRNIDVFSYVPEAKQMAVGYKIRRRAGHWTAEPWTWLVDNSLKLTGNELQVDNNAIYMGVLVKPALLKKFGSNAYSLLLGNLRMLQENRSNLVSY